MAPRPAKEHMSKFDYLKLRVIRALCGNASHMENKLAVKYGADFFIREYDGSFTIVD